jgi:hypothetical protein
VLEKQQKTTLGKCSAVIVYTDTENQTKRNKPALVTLPQQKRKKEKKNGKKKLSPILGMLKDEGIELVYVSGQESIEMIRRHMCS